MLGKIGCRAVQVLAVCSCANIVLLELGSDPTGAEHALAKGSCPHVSALPP